MLAIGLMSGTSLDGVDAALVDIQEEVKLIKFHTLPYDQDFKNRLFRNLNVKTAKLSEISTLNFELGHWFVKAIDNLLQGTPYTYQDIAFVASHGQTIWHDPKGQIPSTLQIGEASIIAYHTNIQVVSNFRVMDIAAGGEGAPLVPFSEYYLYRNTPINLVLQNIGGISNLTYIPVGATMEEVKSFDCGVGNIMIDYFTHKYYNKPYDEDGKIALSGHVIETIFNHLKQDAFITRIPPKSTGREQYSQEFMETLSETYQFANYRPQDIIATITELTAYSIAYQYLHFIKQIDCAVICGGGSHNHYILKRLREITQFTIITGEEFGLNSDAKEAVAFAILGYMTLSGKPSNVPSATGAKMPVVLGQITPSPKQKE
ncbi:MAG: anhydro-N-acetylmuramic acid kinase [Bacilli bacterium]|nr:anhydro-N-acetylmuramic acid kinase [Bacilli bacterium]